MLRDLVMKPISRLAKIGVDALEARFVLIPHRPDLPQVLRKLLRDASRGLLACGQRIDGTRDGLCHSVCRGRYAVGVLQEGLAYRADICRDTSERIGCLARPYPNRLDPLCLIGEKGAD